MENMLNMTDTASKRSFTTDDIVLATTLKLKGYRLVGITKIGRRGYFKFDGVDEKILAEYDLCQVFVEATSFASTLRILTGAVKRTTTEGISHEN